MVGLFAVFFGPLFFAMWLFYVPNSWMSSKTQNHGTLIEPAQPLEKFELASVDGDAWLFKMRQVRLTLGRDSERVQRKYLGLTKGLNKQQDRQEIEKIFSKYHRMKVAWFDKQVVDKSLPQFKEFPVHQIYIIDPLGNLMMWYSKDATSKGMKKDLKRLLKVSKIG